MLREYQICTKCIMDTTDPDIQFDENGICNHCKEFERKLNEYPHYLTNEKRKIKLDQIIKTIKEEGRNRRYDCVVGVSGGVDSSYSVYIVKELGLRPLAVHLDNGWNSELAVRNIEKILNRLDIDLYTHVLDWEEFKSMQIAFLKASVPEAEFPTDHAILPVLFNAAAKLGVKYIILGSNTRTEGIMPKCWVYGHRDWKYIKSVHAMFASIRLRHYPHTNLYNLLYFKFIRRIKIVSILNYLPYKKMDAIKILEDELGWKYYGDKHYESIYTRFFQGYILPKKFNIDKRKPHLSALVLSGEITRQEALAEMKRDTYSAQQAKDDKEYVIKKLGLPEEKFDEIMSAPVKSFWDYPSYHKHPLFKLAKAINQFNYS